MPAATPPADRAEVVDPELARKTAQIEWALKQDAIKQDPDGQWASQARSSSAAVWSGTDATTDLNYFVVEFPKTAYKTGRLKLTLATNIVSRWNQIDAVQLVGTEQ